MLQVGADCEYLRPGTGGTPELLSMLMVKMQSSFILEMDAGEQVQEKRKEEEEGGKGRGDAKQAHHWRLGLS